MFLMSVVAVVVAVTVVADVSLCCGQNAAVVVIRQLFRVHKRCLISIRFKVLYLVDSGGEQE